MRLSGDVCRFANSTDSPRRLGDYREDVGMARELGDTEDPSLASVMRACGLGRSAAFYVDGRFFHVFDQS